MKRPLPTRGTPGPTQPEPPPQAIPSRPARPPRHPRPPRIAWDEAVAELAITANAQPGRLMAVRGLEHWRPFVAAWATSAAFLARCGDGITIRKDEYDANTFDQNLAWAWEQVDHRVDPLLHTIDSRSPLSSPVIFQIFEVLRGAALILPNGQVLPLAADLAESHARAESSRLIAASAASAAIVARANAEIRDASKPEPPAQPATPKKR